MQVGNGELAVAAVAEIGHDLTGLHHAAIGDAGRQPPLGRAGTVVGAGCVVVDVVVAVVPAFGVLDDETPPGRAVVRHQVRDDAVSRGEQRLEPAADDVVADVTTRAVRPTSARAPVVVVGDRASHREADQPHRPVLRRGERASPAPRPRSGGLAPSSGPRSWWSAGAVDEASEGGADPSDGVKPSSVVPGPLGVVESEPGSDSGTVVVVVSGGHCSGSPEVGSVVVVVVERSRLVAAHTRSWSSWWTLRPAVLPGQHRWRL